MGTNLRSFFFWFIDRVQKSQIRKHYTDIKFHYNFSNTIDSKKITEERLQNILDHALKTVPFYRNLSLNNLELASFPVVDKNIVKNNFSLFRSKDFQDDKILTSVITSGSTGTPFKIFQNKEKKLRNRHYCLIIRYLS